jgi:peptidoglycan/LPS O-acetylase OafA/YrhL
MQSRNLDYQPRLDHLRCLAAMLVCLFHIFHYYYLHGQPAAERPWLGLLAEGHTGVGLFFTLSGFLFMTIALSGGAIDYANFVRNRFLRIFPLFVLVFFVAISIGRDDFKGYFPLYLFFSNLGEAPTSATFITGAAWTISLEFTFYLVFPFLARFTLERGAGYLWRLLLLLLVIKLAAYQVSPRSTHMFDSTLVGRFDQFLIGMLAAVLYTPRREWIKARTGVLLPLALLAVLFNSMLQARYASYFLPQPKQLFWISWSTQEALGWACLITTYQASSFRWPDWLERLLRRGGEISYSFYLLHGMVIYLAYTLVGPITVTGRVLVDGLLNTALIVPLCWLVSGLSYDTIEKPFLELRRKYH